jgi:hypothetical protein
MLGVTTVEALVAKLMGDIEVAARELEIDEGAAWDLLVRAVQVLPESEQSTILKTPRPRPVRPRPQRPGPAEGGEESTESHSAGRYPMDVNIDVRLTPWEAVLWRHALENYHMRNRIGVRGFVVHTWPKPYEVERGAMYRRVRISGRVTDAEMLRNVRMSPIVESVKAHRTVV